MSPYIKNVNHGRQMGLPLFVVPNENSHFTYYISHRRPRVSHGAIQIESILGSAFHLPFHISQFTFYINHHCRPISKMSIMEGKWAFPFLWFQMKIHILHITFHTEDPEFHTGLFKLNPFWVLHFTSHFTSHISHLTSHSSSKLVARSSKPNHQYRFRNADH